MFDTQILVLVISIAFGVLWLVAMGFSHGEIKAKQKKMRQSIYDEIGRNYLRNPSIEMIYPHPVKGAYQYRVSYQLANGDRMNHVVTCQHSGRISWDRPIQTDNLDRMRSDQQQGKVVKHLRDEISLLEAEIAILKRERRDTTYDPAGEVQALKRSEKENG